MIRIVSVLALIIAVVNPLPAEAKVFLTVDEALKLAFPNCQVQRKTVFLTDAQIKKAQELANVEVTSGLLNPYEAVCEGKPSATAYFDSHKVRTLPETLMIVVDSAGRVQRIEILSFNEPEDYLPKSAWYGQFVGKALGDSLNLKKDIRSMAGASLSSRATTNAVRRVLALHQVAKTQKAMP